MRYFGVPVRLATIFVFCSALGACSRIASNQSVPISSMRAEVPGAAKVIEMKISRKELQKAIEKGSPTNDIRLVRIFGGGDRNSELPEYRFFEVNPESSYYLLGLRTADILIAAHEFVVFEPAKFATFVANYLPFMEASSIEVRRAENPIVLKYTILE